VNAAHRLVTVEIRESARHLQYTMVAPRRKPHFLGRIAEQLQAGRFGRGVFLDHGG